MFRITANYVEDGMKTPQIMTFDVVLDEDNKIRSKKIFGYSTEDDEVPDRYPFIIEHKNGQGFVDWGCLADESPSKTNIFSKNIKIGEYYTRTDYDEGEQIECIYIISRIDLME